MSMTHDEMIVVITHHKNGGKVQGSVKNSQNWFDYEDGKKPSWNFIEYDYRAKPEPLVLWAVYVENTVHRSGESSDFMLRVFVDYAKSYKNVTLKKFVEVAE